MTIASLMTNGIETLSKGLMTLKEMQADFDQYDIRIPEVFQKHLLSNEDPRKVYLDDLFSRVPGENKIASIQDKLPPEFISHEGRGIVAEVKEIKSFIKVKCYPGYVSNCGGAIASGFADVEELLRIPMREIMQKCISENRYQEIIKLPEKKFYPIPSRPQAIHRFNYCVIAKRKKVQSIKDTVRGLVYMDPVQAEKLIRALFSLSEKTGFIDGHLGNVRLNKRGNKFVIIDTEPFDAYDTVFKRPAENRDDYSNIQAQLSLRVENAIRSFKEFSRMLFLSNKDRIESCKKEHPDIYQQYLRYQSLGAGYGLPETKEEKRLQSIVEKITKEFTNKLEALKKKNSVIKSEINLKIKPILASKRPYQNPSKPKEKSLLSKIVKIALIIIFFPITIPLLILKACLKKRSSRAQRITHNGLITG